MIFSWFVFVTVSLLRAKPVLWLCLGFVEVLLLLPVEDEFCRRFAGRSVSFSNDNIAYEMTEFSEEALPRVYARYRDAITRKGGRYIFTPTSLDQVEAFIDALDNSYGPQGTKTDSLFSVPYEEREEAKAEIRAGKKLLNAVTALKVGF